MYITAAAVIGAATGAAILTAWSGRRAKISEFRQVWINELRADIAAFLGTVRRYRDAESGDTADQLRYEADVTFNRIKLRMNPRPNRNKEQDDEFIAALTALFKKPPEKSSRNAKDEAERKWHIRFDCAMSHARELLKREWEVTKSPFLAGGKWARGGDAGNLGGGLAASACVWLTAFGLAVAAIASVIAVVQLADTRRVVSLVSSATVRETYSVPKMQFYARTFETSEQLESDTSVHNLDALTRMYLIEYLGSIEFVADAYLRGLVDEESAPFVTEYVKEDIEHLLFCFYDGEEGSTGLTHEISVPWIRAHNMGWNDIGGYPATLALAQELRVRLVPKDC